VRTHERRADDDHSLEHLRARLRDSEALAAHLSAEVRALAALRDEARQATAQALEASHAKERFLALMSHELRTPLTTILATNQLMLLGDLSPPQRQHALAVQRAGDSLLRLINSVLDLSKLQASCFDLVPEPFDLCAALEDAVEPMREAAARKHLVLDWIASSEVPTSVRGDAVRFKQVVTNLLANAVKFTERGGVMLRVSASEHAEGRCKLRVEVTDTGIGVSAEMLPTLFQAFSQAHPDRAGAYGGTGLGLCICRQIAELMGGSAGATSEVGKGSTFWFDGWLELSLAARSRRSTSTHPLPLRDAANDATPAQSRQGATPVLLVVEDEPVNRRLFGLLAERLGYTVETAPDGPSAVAAVARGGFGAVLMDCNMDGMDGFEATQAIRALSGDVSQTPVIAVTARALQGDRERCLEAGMDDYLSKPVEMRQLYGVLARWAPLPDADRSTPQALAAAPSSSGSAGRSRADMDFSILESLRVYGKQGDEDLLSELVALYVRDARVRAQSLVDAVEARQVAPTRSVAHALKGMSSNIGARKVERLSRWLEVADRFEDWSMSRDVARAIVAEIEVATRTLREFVSGAIAAHP
jgi:signal transduction histidine kinase/ActR/RegA family two-component response regulator/HPt (histidine-containing phosphotransfer) domain-containing protein